MSDTHERQTTGRYSDPISDQWSERRCDAEGREQRVEGREQRVEVNPEAPRFARHLGSEASVQTRCGSGKLELGSQPQTARAAVEPDARTPRIWSAQLSRDATKADDRAIHTLIEFATATDDGNPRTLWARPRRDRVIIQAATLNSESIPGVLDCIVGGNAVPLKYDEGSLVRLSLIGNPARCIAGKWGAAPEAMWDQWLIDRLVGVTVQRVSHQMLAPSRSVKPRHQVTLRRAAFTALATVTSPEDLARQLVTGIGRGRAYGCGLLIAAEVQR